MSLKDRRKYYRMRKAIKNVQNTPKSKVKLEIKQKADINVSEPNFSP